MSRFQFLRVRRFAPSELHPQAKCCWGFQVTPTHPPFAEHPSCSGAPSALVHCRLPIRVCWLFAMHRLLPLHCPARSVPSSHKGIDCTLDCASNGAGSSGLEALDPGRFSSPKKPIAYGRKNKIPGGTGSVPCRATTLRSAYAAISSAIRTRALVRKNGALKPRFLTPIF